MNSYARKRKSGGKHQDKWFQFIVASSPDVNLCKLWVVDLVDCFWPDLVKHWGCLQCLKTSHKKRAEFRKRSQFQSPDGKRWHVFHVNCLPSQRLVDVPCRTLRKGIVFPLKTKRCAKVRIQDELSWQELLGGPSSHFPHEFAIQAQVTMTVLIWFL